MAAANPVAPMAAPMLPPSHSENTHAEEAAYQAACVFFEGYLRSVLQMLTNIDRELSYASWRAYLSPDFVSVAPSGEWVKNDERVLNEWHCALFWGHYSFPALSQVSLVKQETNGSYDCHATLQRHYEGKCEMAREVLRLRATASSVSEGRLRVQRHSYEPPLPRGIGGHCSRSQIGQDLWVLHRFPSLPDGFFLEVGANHPEELSNTWLLEKAANWRGLCIEPFPVGDWSTRLAQLVKLAVGPEGGRLQFIAPGHVLGGLVGSVDLERVQRDVPKEEQAMVEVRTDTLANIFREARPWGFEVPKVIHYLSLDTEGSELDILQTFPFDECKLLSLTVEHNFKEPARTQIREMLQSKGFQLDACVEFDDFFLLEGYERYLNREGQASPLFVGAECKTALPTQTPPPPEGAALAGPPT